MRRRIFGGVAEDSRARPRPAPGYRIYTIGDVHGRADLLERAFAKIDADMRAHPACRHQTVLLGDYVDRGPDSRRVLDMLIAREQTHDVICLMGNHEEMMLQFLEDPTMWELWSRLGGIQTLLSYGMKSYGMKSPLSAAGGPIADLAGRFAAALPPSHAAFLARLPYSYESGDVLFVHAGVRPGIPLDAQASEDLIWIRDEFLNFRGRFEKLVVHGHTPAMEPQVLSNRINIDTGAYATGRLSCLVLQDEALTFL